MPTPRLAPPFWFRPADWGVVLAVPYGRTGGVHVVHVDAASIAPTLAIAYDTSRRLIAELRVNRWGATQRSTVVHARRYSYPGGLPPALIDRMERVAIRQVGDRFSYIPTATVGTPTHMSERYRLRGAEPLPGRSYPISVTLSDPRLTGLTGHLATLTSRFPRRQYDTTMYFMYRLHNNDVAIIPPAFLQFGHAFDGAEVTPLLVERVSNISSTVIMDRVPATAPHPLPALGPTVTAA